MTADSLKQIDDVIAAGPYAASWESLSSYQAPAWYQEGKLGIFVHWGVYSVPAFANEWYARNMYLQGTREFDHHVATHGPQSQFGYKDFIPSFRGEQFDPDAWADLFKRAGARYVVPVAEHHDGFAMYDCSLSEWTAVKMGPKRDVVGDLAAAVRRLGLVFGVSSHRAEHWWFFDGGTKFDSDVQDPRFHGLYGPARPAPSRETREKEMVDSPPDQAFLDDWLLRTCELVDRYRTQLVWFDWWIMHQAFVPYLQKFAAYLYNRGAQWNQGVAINYKLEAFPEGTAVYDIERGQLSGIRPILWQTDTAISKNSWGYVKNQDYKTATAVIHDFIDIVSKNGALLLDVGPRPDGTIPEPEQAVLLELGRWLDVNGEAVYGTRFWKVFGEGPTAVQSGGFTDTKREAFTSDDIRFTTKGDALYAICLGWPAKEWTIESLGGGAGKVVGVTMLGSQQPVTWSQDERALRIAAPIKKPCDHAYAFKVALEGR